MDTAHTGEMYEGTPESTPILWSDSGYITATPSPFNSSSSEIVDGTTVLDGQFALRGINDTPVTSQKSSKVGNLRKHLLTEDCNHSEVEALNSPSYVNNNEVDNSVCYFCSSSKYNRGSDVLGTVTEGNGKLTESFSHLLVDESVCNSTVNTPVHRESYESSSNVFHPRGSVTKFSSNSKNKTSIYLEKLSVKKFKQDLSFVSLHRRSQSGGSNLLRQYTCIGVSRLDFFVHLAGVSGCFPGIISQILSYLSAEDLVTMCLVSSEWRRVCVDDPAANQRRLAHVRHVKHSKENIIWNQFKQTSHTLNLSMSSGKGVFREIQNTDRRDSNASSSPTTPRSPPVSPSKVRFNIFMKAGVALDEGTRLVRCPRCSHPAQASSDRARCQAIGCQYNFCIFCFCDIHDSLPCQSRSVAPVRRKTSCVGSKESRRNLRRL